MSIINPISIKNEYNLPAQLYTDVVSTVNNYFDKLCQLCNTDDLPFEPGIILIIGQATDFFTQQDSWDEIVYKFMRVFRQEFLEGKHTNLSFSYGLPYISSIIHFYSSKTGYYKKLLSSLDKTILSYLNQKMDSITLSSKIKTADFDLIFGMSGVAQYLFALPEENTHSLLTKIAQYLCSLTHYKTYKDFSVPGWYVGGDDPLTTNSKEIFPNGHINYGLAHGITGVLASLIKLGERNIQKQQINDAIETILFELEKVKFVSQEGIVYYSGMLNIDHYIENKFFEDRNFRMSWCYGSVSTLYTLYRAYEYTKNFTKCKQIINEVEKIAISGNKCWLLESPIICHGYAGTAHIFKNFYIKSNSPIIKQCYEELITLVLNTYNVDYLYGFRDILYKLNNNIWEKHSEDKNTFLEGGSGIISVLLGFLSQEEYTSTLLLLS